MKKQKLLMLLAVTMAFILTAGMVSAAELTEVVADVIYSSNTNSEGNSGYKNFPMSVYPGKTSYAGTGEDGDVSGDFDGSAGTVFDYLFINCNSSNDGFDIRAEGGLNLFSVPTALNGYAGNENWGLLWTTNDPDTELANFDTVRTAKAKTVTGTVDIFNLQSGVVYFLYGGYRSQINIDLTMSGNGQPDVVLVNGGQIQCNNNEMILAGFEFTDAAGYDTITYETYSSDSSAGRGRFMGAIIDAVASPAAPTDVSPANRELVDPPPADVVLSWTNIDPCTVEPVPVYVDVWFGTDPNKNEPSTYWKLSGVSGVEDLNTVTVSDLAPGIYYWQIDSYLQGVSTGDPIEGRVYMFTNDGPIVSVDAGVDMITWVNEPVPLIADVNDDGGSALTYLWTSDIAGVTFDPSANDPSPTVTLDPPRRVVRGIQANGDDAEQYINSMASGASTLQGTMKSLTDGDLELGSETDATGLDWQVIAVQFDQLGIPQGAAIIGAKITFEVQNSGVSDPGSSNDFTILAEAIDNAAAFTTDPNNITDRVLSAASVAWAPDGLPAVNAKIDTPDLTSLIQETVDREGWSADNRLTLMIYPDVYLASPTGGTTQVQEIEFEAGPGADAPTLTIDYISTEPSSVATVVTITLDVFDETNPVVSDSMTIDVYDTACLVTRVGLGETANNPTDFNGDCDTDIEDLAIMAAKWLYDASAEMTTLKK